MGKESWSKVDEEIGKGSTEKAKAQSKRQDRKCELAKGKSA